MGKDPQGEAAGLAASEAVIREEITAARSGDAAAGRALLQRISLGLSRGDLHPLLADYHADCLWSHLRLGVSLERALHVYRYQEKPTAHDPVELAAVFELLVEFGGMKKGAAKGWIKQHLGAAKQTTEAAAAAVDIRALDVPDDGDAASKAYRRARYLDLLLHTAGSLRRAVGPALERV